MKIGAEESSTKISCRSAGFCGGLRLRPFLSAVSPDTVMPDGLEFTSPGDSHCKLGCERQPNHDCGKGGLISIESLQNSLSPGSIVPGPRADEGLLHQGCHEADESEPGKSTCPTIRYSSNLARCMSRVARDVRSRHTTSAEVEIPEMPKETNDEVHEITCSSPAGPDLASEKWAFPPFRDEHGLEKKEKDRLDDWGEQEHGVRLHQGRESASDTGCCIRRGSNSSCEAAQDAVSPCGRGLRCISLPNTPLAKTASDTKAGRDPACKAASRRCLAFIEKAVTASESYDGKSSARSRWIHATWWASQEVQRKSRNLRMFAQHVISRAENTQRGKNSQDAVFPSHIKVLNAPAVQLLVVVCSLFIVFGADVYFSLTPPPSMDTALYSVHLVCWIVLVLEMAVRIPCQHMYIRSFFFLLDAGALLTALPEVVWFLFGVNVVQGPTFVSVLRGLRSVRLSTKLARAMSAMHVHAAEQRCSCHAVLAGKLRRRASDGARCWNPTLFGGHIVMLVYGCEPWLVLRVFLCLSWIYSVTVCSSCT
jgi:hypothetical protein